MTEPKSRRVRGILSWLILSDRSIRKFRRGTSYLSLRRHQPQNYLSRLQSSLFLSFALPPLPLCSTFFSFLANRQKKNKKFSLLSKYRRDISCSTDAYLNFPALHGPVHHSSGFLVSNEKLLRSFFPYLPVPGPNSCPSLLPFPLSRWDRLSEPHPQCRVIA